MVKGVKKDLAAAASESGKKALLRFFKKPIDCYGVPYPIVRNIAKKHLPAVPKEKLLEQCEQLLQGKHEEKLAAIHWLKTQEFTKEEFTLLERYIHQYIDDWATCDLFCPYIIRPLLQEHPELIERVASWTMSPHTYTRRAACTSFLQDGGGVKPTPFPLPVILDVCTRLLQDPEDHVQKGYGWLLKNASKVHQDGVFEFIMEHKEEMPRTALRYAIEHMPQEKRQLALLR